MMKAVSSLPRWSIAIRPPLRFQQEGHNVSATFCGSPKGRIASKSRDIISHILLASDAPALIFELRQASRCGCSSATTT